MKRASGDFLSAEFGSSDEDDEDYVPEDESDDGCCDGLERVHDVGGEGDGGADADPAEARGDLDLGLVGLEEDQLDGRGRGVEEGGGAGASVLASSAAVVVGAEVDVDRCGLEEELGCRRV